MIRKLLFLVLLIYNCLFASINITKQQGSIQTTIDANIVILNNKIDLKNFQELKITTGNTSQLFLEINNHFVNIFENTFLTITKKNKNNYELNFFYGNYSILTLNNSGIILNEIYLNAKNKKQYIKIEKGNITLQKGNSIQYLKKNNENYTYENSVIILKKNKIFLNILLNNFDKNINKNIISKINVITEYDKLSTQAAYPLSGVTALDGPIIIAGDDYIDNDFNLTKNNKIDTTNNFTINYLLINGYSYDPNNTLELSTEDLKDNKIVIEGYSSVGSNIKRIVAIINNTEYTVNGKESLQVSFTPTNNTQYEIQFKAYNKQEKQIADSSKKNVKIKYTEIKTATPETTVVTVEKITYDTIYQEAIYPSPTDNVSGFMIEIPEDDYVEETNEPVIVEEKQSITKTSPINNASITTLIPSFQWQDFTNASYYIITITKTPYNDDNIILNKKITSTFYSFSLSDAAEELKNNNSYLWLIAAYDVNNNLISNLTSDDIWTFNISIAEQTVDTIPIEIPNADLTFNNVKIGNTYAEQLKGTITLLKDDLDNGQLLISGDVNDADKVSSITIYINNYAIIPSLTDNSNAKHFEYAYTPSENVSWTIKISAINVNQKNYDCSALDYIDKFIFYNVTEQDLIDKVFDNLSESILTENKTEFLECISTDFYGTNKGYKTYYDIKSSIDNDFAKQSSSTCKFDNRQYDIGSTSTTITTDFERIINFSNSNKQKTIKTKLIFNLTKDENGDWKILNETTNSFFIKLYPDLPELPINN